MSIKVNNLSKNFGIQKAVNSISFEINEGEIVGFLGPNGAGKSTTLKMLIGQLKPDVGQAKIDQFDIENDPIEIKKIIGYLAENNPMYKDMYVKEFLQFVGEIHGISSQKLKTRIQEVINLVGLEKEQKKKIHELSKGYQQRVGIAHAILHDPKILILDEPTSGLDPNQMTEIRNLIKNLSPGKIILFSSHLLNEVEAICDRILLIHLGELRADCSLAEAKAYNGGLEAFFKEKTKQ
jgi:ABC-2 type transport system ATP-binding protein